jgi:hypothetical protein
MSGLRLIAAPMPPLSEENRTGEERHTGTAMVELGGEGCA